VIETLQKRCGVWAASHSRYDAPREAAIRWQEEMVESDALLVPPLVRTGGPGGAQELKWMSTGNREVLCLMPYTP